MRAVLASLALISVLVTPFIARGAVCTPVSIGWSVSPDTSVIAADADAVYWRRYAATCNGGMEIVRTAKAGGTSTVLATVKGRVGDSLAVDDSNVWLLVDDAIVAVPKSGGASSTVFPATGDHRASLIVGSGALYVAEQHGGDVRLVRYPLDGSAPVVLATGLCGFEMMVLDGGDLVVAVGQDIRRIPIDGSTPTTILSGKLWRRFAIDGNDLFYFDWQGLWRMPKTGGPAVQLRSYASSAQQATPTAFMADARHLYWTDQLYLAVFYDQERELWIADRDGSNAQMLGHLNTTALVGDGSSLYTVEQPGGLLRRDLACAASTQASAGAADTCAPQLVARVQATQLIADPAGLFALDGSGIALVDAAGQVTRLFAHTGLVKMLIDANAIYSTDGTSVWRIPRTGGSPTVLATGSSITDLWLDDASVYFLQWTVPLDWKVVPKTGGAPAEVNVPPGTFFVGVDATFIYGIDNTSTTQTRQIWKRDKATGAVSQLSQGTTSLGNARGLMLDGTNLYLLNHNAYGDGFYSLPLAGGAIQTYWNPPSRGWLGFAVADDNESLLVTSAWSDDGLEPQPRGFDISVSSKDGSSRAVIEWGDGAGGGTAPALTKDAFYWVSSEGIVRTPRGCEACPSTPQPLPYALDCAMPGSNGGVTPSSDGGASSPADAGSATVPSGAVDAGVATPPDLAASSVGVMPNGPDAGCGCSLTGSAPPALPLAVVLAVAAWLVVRQRRRDCARDRLGRRD